MAVDKRVRGSKECPHKPAGIEVCHTSVVVARIVVGLAEGQTMLEDVVDCLSLSTI